MAVKIVAVLILMKFLGTYAWQVSEHNSHARNTMRNLVKIYGPINFVSDYIFLHKEKKYSRKFLQYLSDPEDDFTKLHLIEMYGREQKMNFKAYSIDENVNYQSYDVKVNTNFLKDEKCVKNVETVAWKVTSKESICVMMIACHATPSDDDKSYEIRTRLLFLVDQNFNLSTINNFLIGFKFKSNTTNTFNNFFLGGGFCMCEYLDEYFNGFNVKPLDFRLVILMFLFIITLCTFFGIFLKIINNDIE